MTQLLRWSDAKASDRGALTNFTCADTPLSRRRPWEDHTRRWWEHKVQRYVRDLRPPYRPPEYLRVARDPKGKILAVSHFELVDSGAEARLHIMALDVSLRRQGGGYADAMFEDTLDLVTEQGVEAGLLESRIVGFIWHENSYSQQMCRRFGLWHSEDSERPGMQVWTRVLPLIE